MTALRVLVSEDACCASGRCADTEPRVFDQDSEGTVVLLREQVDGELADAATLCAELCPCGAITVEPVSG